MLQYIINRQKNILTPGIVCTPPPPPPPPLGDGGVWAIFISAKKGGGGGILHIQVGGGGGGWCTLYRWWSYFLGVIFHTEKFLLANFRMSCNCNLFMKKGLYFILRGMGISVNFVNIQRKHIYPFSYTKYDRPEKSKWLSWLVFHSQKISRFVGGDCLRWWELGISILRRVLDYIGGGCYHLAH